MAVPVEEYLHTSFPGVDCEYRDGEIMERTMPDYLHGRTQGLLFLFFELLRVRLSVYVCLETRMKIREGLYLIPDVAVFYANEPTFVPDSPPLIAIEILSPDDRLAAVRDKLEEYIAWGVTHVWLADPHARRLYRYESGLIEVTAFAVPELSIEIQPDQIFDRLTSPKPVRQ